MNFLIITGMSGAGKSRTLTVLEDMGYYCIDNMPISLIPEFAKLGAYNEKYNKVALVTDIREGASLELLDECISSVSKFDIKTKILFLDANNETLAKRYKETRRRHPLMDENTPANHAIALERELLTKIRENADFLIDTSNFSSNILREHLALLFSGDNPQTIMINVMSFGFKHATPTSADIMFDVRFLPNPYYIDDLREKSGLDSDVYDYVFSHQDAIDFRDKLFDMMDFLLPKYIYEGKTSLIIAIGCTGGRHRSVSIARALANHLANNDYNVVINHRDYKLV